MKPKDLVIDLFGDYIRYVGGSVRLSDLVALLGLFGVEPATVRVTASRMRQRGWMTSRRQGRETVYTATSRLMQMLDEGRERIFAPARELWRGQWTAVLYQIPESRRSERERLKRQLSWEGFGQLNVTTWISPRDVRERTRLFLGCAESSDVHVFSMSTGSLERDRALIDQCWKLDELARDYQDFISRWKAWQTEHLAAVQPREAFMARVELVSTYRRFPFRDPMLPTALEPLNWPGDAAFRVFSELHRDVAGLAMEFLVSMLNQASSPAPEK